MNLISEIQGLSMIFVLAFLVVFSPVLIPVFFKTVLLVARVFLKTTDIFYNIFVQKK